MSSRNGLLAGGNWIVDAVKIIDVWPQQDALANIRSQTQGTGGSPFNVLVDLALMGGGFPLEAVGLVGNDAHGRFILNTCHELGIQTQALQITPDAPTSYTDVMTVADSGRRTFFHARGANALLGDEHFDFSKTTARLFHLGYLLLLDGMDHTCPEYGTVAAKVLARARAAGIKTSIDVVSEDSERFAKIVLPAVRHVDYCIMNEFEAGRVTGLKIRTGNGLDLGALRCAMEKLLEAGVKERVLIHFPEGACALGADGAWTTHGSVILPEGYIKGAAGAGDAFTAGVLLGWHQGQSVEEQLRLGVCAAAANLSDETCTAGLRPVSECLALGAKYGFRSVESPIA
jgi:sugar/nucleoside kinase (ribokinase family)